MLLKAASNRCKLIRFEWVLNSKIRNQWLDESKYLLENYVSSETFDDYDEMAFDIQLIKFIRAQNEPHSQKVNLFARFKNIYLIRDSSEYENDLDHDDVDDNNDDDDDDYHKQSADDINELDVLLKRRQNTLYDLFIDLLTKFGATLTSRASMAEFIIAIDKTNDFDDDENNNEHRIAIENEKAHFDKCIKHIEHRLRKKNGAQILSSNWIIGKFLELVSYV